MKKLTRNRLRIISIILLVVIFSSSLILLFEGKYGSHFLVYWIHFLPLLYLTLMIAKEVTMAIKTGKQQNIIDDTYWNFKYDIKKDKRGFWLNFGGSLILLLIFFALGISLLIIPFL